MKKFIKSISVYLTVVMLLCSMLVVPAFATSDVPQIELWDKDTDSLALDGDSFPSAPWGHYYAVYLLQPGTYEVIFGSLSDSEFVCNHSTYSFLQVFWTEEAEDGSRIAHNVDMLSGDSFEVTDDMLIGDVCEFYVNSYLVEPIVTVYSEPVIDNPDVELPPEGDDVGVQGGIYYQAFDMLAGYIYGEGAELTAEQNMTMTILATICALFVVVVPFLIVFWFIRIFR